MVDSFSARAIMEEMAISRFKATCLAVLERVRKTGKPLRITRFGKPVAEIVPPTSTSGAPRLGALKKTMTITGDLVAPATAPDDWDALAE